MSAAAAARNPTLRAVIMLSCNQGETWTIQVEQQHAETCKHKWFILTICTC